MICYNIVNFFCCKKIIHVLTKCNDYKLVSKDIWIPKNYKTFGAHKLSFNKMIVLKNFCSFLACECNPIGSQNNACDRETGQCQCQRNYGSRQCEECNDGFYNYPSCSSKYQTHIVWSSFDKIGLRGYLGAVRMSHHLKSMTKVAGGVKKDSKLCDI